MGACGSIQQPPQRGGRSQEPQPAPPPESLLKPLSGTTREPSQSGDVPSSSVDDAACKPGPLQPSITPSSTSVSQAAPAPEEPLVPGEPPASDESPSPDEQPPAQKGAASTSELSVPKSSSRDAGQSEYHDVDISTFYVLGDEIGEGTTAVVRKATLIGTREYHTASGKSLPIPKEVSSSSALRT